MTPRKFTPIAVVIINVMILLNTTVTFANNLSQLNKLKTSLTAKNFNSLFKKSETSKVLVSYIEKSDTIIQNVKTSETRTKISLNISAQEKEALMALYNSTDGTNWKNKSGWDVTNPNAVVTNWDENTQTGWYGVTVVNGKVTQLNLANNNLNGTIPSQIGQLINLTNLNLNNNRLIRTIPNSIGLLTNLTNLYLNNNYLYGFLPNEMNQLTNLSILHIENNQLEGKSPNLTGLNLSRLNIQNNRFYFSDFSSEYSTYISNLGVYFKYTPQLKTDYENTHTEEIGSSINLIMLIGNRVTSSDTFQWYKGTSPNGVLIEGATSKQYTISNLTASNAGTYYCIAKNPQITDLVLERNPIHLNTTPCHRITGDIKINNNGSIMPEAGYPFHFSNSGAVKLTACNETEFPNTFYAATNTPILSLGTQLYTNPSLITPVGSGNLWHKLADSGTAYRIDNSGKVAEVYNCTPANCNANVTANQYAQTIFSGKAPTITLSSTTPGTTFSWTVAVQSQSILGAFSGNGNSINQVLTNIGTTNGTATYTITPTFNSCSGTPIVVVVTVKPASESPYARIIYEAACRTGGCANSSDCAVQIPVELYNAPPTHTFTLTVTSNPESNYVLEMTRDYGTFYRLHYLEHVTSHPTVYFTLTLKDSEGNIIYESEEELPSSSAWANTSACN